jgi:hypothetical protein
VKSDTSAAQAQNGLVRFVTAPRFHLLGLHRGQGRKQSVISLRLIKSGFLKPSGGPTFITSEMTAFNLPYNIGHLA